MNNYKTKRYQALNEIETKFKILLSDVPLPNKFYDIYSIFNYLMKNKEIFGSYEEFKSKYISKKSSKISIPNESLQQFIQHYVLRREKDNQEEFDKEMEESEYSEICDEDSEDYDDLRDFIIEDEKYIEEQDIDENDSQYSNIYWKEELNKIKTQSNLEEDNDLNKDLLELKISQKINNKEYLNTNKGIINNSSSGISKNIINKYDSNLIINDRIKENIYIKNEKGESVFNNNIYCSHCRNLIIENEDGSIRCSKCGKYEHFACTGVPYDMNIKRVSSLRYYYCHKCRNLDNFYSYDNGNKSSIEYDKTLDSKSIKENDYILKYLQTEDTYDKILHNYSYSFKDDDIKMEERDNDDNYILNVTGKFGMETSIDNLSSILKNSYGNITCNINNGDVPKFKESLTDENYRIYQNYICKFKMYLETNDKVNALNSLLKANKLNSNDLNLHWWIVKIIIDLNII
ncbi:hypothetical protein PIROE2DRAFT_4321 [Piromyces sp. E2]|nr:hypothetical protein PIROE2DRAFT_4321 [Piromyces sp. E2]|eukprot:OUM68038.1 hypothetical protein PIROE2DRAFT_4321 [Piromyces sp. E2]